MFNQNMVQLALNMLEESDLDNDINKTFIINHPKYAHDIFKTLALLKSTKPSLSSQKNFNRLTQNFHDMRLIIDILQSLGLPLRTQDNLDSLFQYTHTPFLKEIQAKVIDALPYAGGNNAIEPIDQKRFDEIINEAKLNHVGNRPSFTPEMK